MTGWDELVCKEKDLKSDPPAVPDAIFKFLQPTSLKLQNLFSINDFKIYKSSSCDSKRKTEEMRMYVQ